MKKLKKKVSIFLCFLLLFPAITFVGATIFSEAASGSGNPFAEFEQYYIYVDSPGGMNTYYIPNGHEYFTGNPRHGLNETGTCGAIAVQLLLSYDNYYIDRRIIDDRHLNGYDFELGEVTQPSDNPNHCDDPMDMTRETLGTSGVSDSDSETYFSYLVEGGENRLPLWPYIWDDELGMGLDNLLTERNNEISGEISYEILQTTIGMVEAKAEIDAGRPFIADMRVDYATGWANHYVVAYGYQTRMVNNEERFGFITHQGYSGDEPFGIGVWMDAAAIWIYTALRIDHAHEYDIHTNNDYNEVQCSECGHRSVERTVTLDKQGGSGGTTSVDAVVCAPMPTVTMPTRTGYIFAGYYTAPNGCGTKYYNADMTSAISYNMNEGITLYAYWIFIADLDNYCVFELDNGTDNILLVYCPMLNPTEFILFTPTGGTYMLEVFMRGGGGGMVVIICEYGDEEIIYELEDDPVIYEEIDLDANIYYFVQVYNDSTGALVFYVHNT